MRSYIVSVFGTFETEFQLDAENARAARRAASHAMEAIEMAVGDRVHDIDFMPRNQQIQLECDTPRPYKGDIGLLRTVLDGWFAGPLWGWSIYNNKRKAGMRQMKIEQARVISEATPQVQWAFAEEIQEAFGGRVVSAKFVRREPGPYGEKISLMLYLRD